ncbi:MAG: transcriptional regulator [Phenylobacterium sp.]|uniref:winged helix-turn-helix transcriptional regulator n=1 Tax=Phenylobacterium sp. TaxID=1871053 RepID=UPI001A33DA21|nr:winged helix-turn-helix transcriptional regulator [Phenylobacterium sp.]MBJ7411357.1 transcriptional regulator [Phenylobacterium sp.]
MKGYGQFCPVAKTAEIFAQRWTPLVVRELCFGPRRFTEIHSGVPLMSRALLVQRLTELEEAGVVATEPLAQGKLYSLTPAGEQLSGIVCLMSEWGQRHGQGRIAHEELDPTLLMWGMRRQIATSELPAWDIVLRLEFRGIPRAHAARRYWWMILRRTDVEVCLKDPGAEVDVVLSADLEAFVRVWLGRKGLSDAMAEGEIALSGAPAKVAELKRVLRLRDAPDLRVLSFRPAA